MKTVLIVLELHVGSFQLFSIAISHFAFFKYLKTNSN